MVSIYVKGEVHTKLLELRGSREEIQEKACELALKEIFRYTDTI